MNFNDVALFSVKGNDYRIHFCFMSKREGTFGGTYYRDIYSGINGK